LAGQHIVLSSDLAHHDPVDTVRITRPRGVNIHQQKMNPAIESCKCLIQKRADSVTARFVTRRKDLDHRDDTVTAPLPDHERALQARVGSACNGQDIRHTAVAAELLGHDVVTFGKQSPHQGTLNFQYPGVMKIVEGAILSARPVMYWHSIAPFS